MRRPNGFTLMEIMIVVVVLGVLAGLATPTYTKTIEKARAGEATANLKALHLGQKVYKVERDAFYGPQAALATINTNLNTDLVQENYALNITAASATAYTATASRIGKTKVFTITQAGAITETGSF